MYDITIQVEYKSWMIRRGTSPGWDRPGPTVRRGVGGAVPRPARQARRRTHRRAVDLRCGRANHRAGGRAAVDEHITRIETAASMLAVGGRRRHPERALRAHGSTRGRGRRPRPRGRRGESAVGAERIERCWRGGSPSWRPAAWRRKARECAAPTHPVADVSPMREPHPSALGQGEPVDPVASTVSTTEPRTASCTSWAVST